MTFDAHHIKDLYLTFLGRLPIIRSTLLYTEEIHSLKQILASTEKRKRKSLKS